MQRPPTLLPVPLVADGLADDTSALQALIDRAAAAFDARGRTIELPPDRKIRITRTLTISSVAGLRFRGNGSRLDWHGNAASPAILVSDVQNSLIEDLDIRPYTPLLVGLQFENGPGGVWAPTNRTLRRIRIGAPSAGLITTGIKWALGAGGDANDDHDLVEQVYVENYASEAFWVAHRQAREQVFVNCQGSANGAGTRFLRCDPDCGGMTVIGGGCSGNDDCDFYFGGSPVGVVIERFTSENSKRYIRTATSTTSGASVSVVGCRWASTGLHADADAIYWRLTGVLNIIGGCIGDSNTPIPRINFGNGDATRTSILNLIGVRFGATNSESVDAVRALAGADRLNRRGCVYQTSGNLIVYRAGDDTAWT
jgi:hypothetical protein